jgi:hypothetical protein
MHIVENIELKSCRDGDQLCFVCRLMRIVIVPWVQMIACVLLQCGEAACTLLPRSGVRCFTDARIRATQLSSYCLHFN